MHKSSRGRERIAGERAQRAVYIMPVYLAFLQLEAVLAGRM